MDDQQVTDDAVAAGTGDVQAAPEVDAQPVGGDEASAAPEAPAV